MAVITLNRSENTVVVIAEKNDALLVIDEDGNRMVRPASSYPVGMGLVNGNDINIIVVRGER